MSEQRTREPAPWRARWQRVRGGARRAAPFISGVASALTAILIYQALAPAPPPLSMADVEQRVATAMAEATPAPAYSAVAFQVIRPSLILVEAETASASGATSGGFGSGVIVSDMGDILTSLHVVAGATSIQVTFADGTQSQALVVAEQPENDIAVLRAIQPPAQLIPAVLGNPNAMQVGDEAFVVGHPFGLYGSMSAGVISGFDRTFRPPDGAQELAGLIQIDAAVNPGNSGGPLLNRYGQVVGIITGLINPTEQDVFVGIGFAVPITTAGGAAGLPPY
jgi:S1-C subfamily serine protease